MTTGGESLRRCGFSISTSSFDKREGYTDQPRPPRSMYIDQTNIFRAIVSDKLGHDTTSGTLGASSSAIPSSQESSRATSPTGIRNRFGGRKDGVQRRRRKVSREEEDEERARRDFLAEAYRIVSAFLRRRTTAHPS